VSVSPGAIRGSEASAQRLLCGRSVRPWPPPAGLVAGRPGSCGRPWWDWLAWKAAFGAAGRSLAQRLADVGAAPVWVRGSRLALAAACCPNRQRLLCSRL